jgi:cytochrome c-type biogenesis protein CcmF
VIPEIGHFALILALSLALCQGIIPLVGAHRNDAAMMAVGRTAANGQLFFVVFAFACLVWAFVQSDFSVLYVANHSQLSLPTIYKVSAVWGAHEGSLLMWILILAIWTVAVSYFSDNLPAVFSARVIGVLGLLSTGFLLFTLLTSNPFERLTPAPADGADLNPLLQDPGLAIHPPILYTGYVGFSVAFAFAIAAMISGNLDQKWAKWTRPWTTVAWLFLTVGIALGSWWAYYELGWGGWWFWDPVENASFMPWLVGTALIHSLAVSERRGLFKSWTLLLAIAAFSLSLLGTFLVRSGILVSVHAFATDPTRGFFILGFLGVVILSALVLYAWRAPGLDSTAGFRPLSRETFLLLNNVLLVIAALLVFIGTLAPLVVEVLNAGKISVGAPWFNVAFAIPMLPLVLLMGLGMHAAWRSQPAAGRALAAQIAYPGRGRAGCRYRHSRVSRWRVRRAGRGRLYCRGLDYRGVAHPAAARLAQQGQAHTFRARHVDCPYRRRAVCARGHHGEHFRHRDGSCAAARRFDRDRQIPVRDARAARCTGTELQRA